MWEKYKYYVENCSVASPPTTRLTVPEEVPAELLATQLYWPASTSCTPRMCSVPRCTSCSTKGAEPTSSSPGSTSNISLSSSNRDISTVILIKALCMALTHLWTSGQEGTESLWPDTQELHHHQQSLAQPAVPLLFLVPLQNKKNQWDELFIPGMSKSFYIIGLGTLILNGPVKIPFLSVQRSLTAHLNPAISQCKKKKWNFKGASQFFHVIKKHCYSKIKKFVSMTLWT